MSSSIVKQFEHLWESGNSPPDVFQFLKEQECTSTDDLIAVLLIDQEYRWNTGNPLKVEDYLDRTPSLSGNNTAISRLLVGELSK